MFNFFFGGIVGGERDEGNIGASTLVATPHVGLMFIAWCHRIPTAEHITCAQRWFEWTPCAAEHILPFSSGSSGHHMPLNIYIRSAVV
jgi:hypothetical protein